MCKGFCPRVSKRVMNPLWNGKPNVCGWYNYWVVYPNDEEIDKLVIRRLYYGKNKSKCIKHMKELTSNAMKSTKNQLCIYMLGSYGYFEDGMVKDDFCDPDEREQEFPKNNEAFVSYFKIHTQDTVRYDSHCEVFPYTEEGLRTCINSGKSYINGWNQIFGNETKISIEVMYFHSYDKTINKFKADVIDIGENVEKEFNNAYSFDMNLDFPLLPQKNVMYGDIAEPSEQTSRLGNPQGPKENPFEIQWYSNNPYMYY
uniref:Uncharacterized protein n=1 Tax=viral metagenome TaxID=1070528 RepID=A0A6C0JPV6_9ZZZZ